MAFDARSYFRKLIENHEPKLHIHESHSNLTDNGPAVYVVSRDVHRFASVSLSSIGIKDKMQADLRFAHAMSTLADAVKYLEDKGKTK